MPGGFLQLLTTGKESEYLNYTPNISFFKSYFRRHTNFFINNLEVFGNFYEKTEVNTFLIPKSGDLLSKGFLKFNFDENYIEILGNYDNMVSTLTSDITLFFDSYNIYINDYDKSIIDNIKNVKFILTNNGIQYFSLMSTYIIEEIKLIYKIKIDKNIYFQKDNTNVLYNINLPYYYYGFIYEINYNDLLNSTSEPNNILYLLINGLNYETMRYFRLDLQNLNIAFKFTFDNFNIYKNLLFFCLQILDSSIYQNICKINQYDIYLSLKFNLGNNVGIEKLIKIVDYIKNLFFGYSNIKARYYTNKIRYSDIIIKKNEYSSFVNNMFGKKYQSVFNKYSSGSTNIEIYPDEYLYYNIIFPSKILNDSITNYFIEMDIFNLKENIIFGNLDTNDYNGSLINNETIFFNTANINNPYSLCVITYIKMFVNLIINKSSNQTIQEFLLIINDNINRINYINKYFNNVDNFNEVILDTIIKNNVLFLNKSSIRSIVYQNVSFNNYNVLVEQFANKKISQYESSIINYYIFKNIIGNINSNSYCAFDMQNLLIESIILANYTNLNFSGSLSTNFFYTNLLNYNNNNNIFNAILYNYFPGFKINEPIDAFNILEQIYKNLENFLYYVIYLTEIIINTSKPIYNISNKVASSIYSNNGLTQQIIYEYPLGNIIFPLTSSFFFYTTNTIMDYNYQNNYNIFYNTNKPNYFEKIRDTIKKLYNSNFDIYNININNSPKNFNEIFDFFNNLFLENIISDYYKKIQIFLSISQYNKITDFISSINGINSQIVYNSVNPDIDNIILYDLFKISDFTLFNGSFSSYTINYPKDNNFYFIGSDLTINTNYLKFIFLPNSPYYRIYYLYNFLTTISTDKKLINEIPEDLLQLRNFLLKYLQIYINNFNYIKLDISNYALPNFNIEPIEFINLNEYFICYDNINILFNEQIKDLFKNSALLKDFYVYAPFYIKKENYLLQKKVLTETILKNQGINIQTGLDIFYLIGNIINYQKYNFDDLVIYYFIMGIYYNNEFFVNVNKIIDFVNAFFQKDDNNYSNVTNILSQIINDSKRNSLNFYHNPQEFINNPNYYNCYYASFSIGTMFDNIDKLITSTINEIYAIPSQLTNINMFSLFYTNKTFDIKNYQNILSYEQVNNGFVYFKNQLFNINVSFGDNLYNYYVNALNGIIKYIFDNFSYSINYLVSEYIFSDLIKTFDEYQDIFNSVNNTDINLYNIVNNLLFDFNIKFYPKKFQTNRIITIYLLYYFFVITFLNSDINKFIQNKDNLITFDVFVNSKYSQNIYLNLLKDIITLLNNTNEKLKFNYSTIYSEYIIISNYIIDLSINLFENKIYNFNTTLTDPNKLTYKIFDNQYNLSDNLNWFQNNIIFPGQISYNSQFYKKYNETILNIQKQNEKLLYISNNKYFLNYITSNNLVSTDLFKTSVDYLNTIYNQTLTIIKKIYNNLQKSYLSYNNFTTTNYGITLIDYIFAILDKFYNNSVNNRTYTYTFMFSNTKSLENFNTGLNAIINNDIYDITKYKSVINDLSFLKDFTTRYFNLRIISSINIERNINRYIYIFINNYILENYKYDQYLINFMNTNSLYDYVKLFNNIYLNTNNIIYQKNLSIYQNDIIYEILNFENYTDQNNFLQNPVFNDFIINFSLYPNNKNSFYKNFKRYLSFLKENNSSNLFDKFILSNGQPIINYFLDVTNLNEFHEYIYNFVNLNESYSPLHIYNNILYLKENTNNNSSISSKISINFDNLMKKILIYLYIVYLINANLFNIINDNISNKLLKNHTLEYDFIKMKVLVNLNNIINTEFLDKLKVYIYYITVFDKNYPSIYNILHNQKHCDKHHKHPHPCKKCCEDEDYCKFKLCKCNNIMYPEYVNQFNNPVFFYDVKNNTNASDYLNLCIKYVSSYEETIGFSDVNIDSVIVQNESNNITFSKLVQSYNVMLNLDQSLNNQNSYFLTNATLNYLYNFYNNVIVDINGINQQKISSSFIINQKKYYTNTLVENTNILFILLVVLLNKYNITYDKQKEDLDNIISNFWIGTFNVNEIFEQLKGYTSDDYIKNNTINLSSTKNLIENTNNTYLSDVSYVFSRSQNIADLSELITGTNNYSNIIPTDYDYDLINFTTKTIYSEGIDIYKKYYLDNYNFYNFQDNYDTIYKSKYTYYNNIINNNYALLNIKNVNLDLFNKIFIDIIYTLLYQPFSIYDGNNYAFTENFNQLIKLYKKYYFSFKLSTTLSDVNNLKLLNYLKISGNQNLTINEIGNYIKQLYYYELFGLPYDPNYFSGTIRDNFKIFIDIIEFNGNYNLEFNYKINNIVLYFESSIILINWYLNKNFNIDKSSNIQIIKILINDIIQEITSFNNISLYFKNFYLYYINQSSELLFNKIVNIINYSDFVNRFSKVIRQLIYYTDNINWFVNLNNAYLSYFKDVKFYYKVYVDNNYIIKEFSLSLNELEQYSVSYINYLLGDNGINNDQSKLYIILKNIIDITIDGVEINTLNILYDFIFNKKNNFTNISDFSNTLTNNLFNLIINMNYGSVYTEYDTIYLNESLDFKLLLLNYIVMSINEPNLTIEYIYNTSQKLKVLYRLEIFYIYITNISDYLFKRNFLYTICNSNKYIYNNIEFLSLSLENDICIYLDFINKNIIKDNQISNYYKTIQNKTIKSIVNYGINNFYNYGANLNFLEYIYLDITTKFNKQNETSILNIFIQNSIINIINQYNLTTEDFTIYKTNVKYITNVFDLILSTFSKTLDIPKSIFGGTNKQNSSIRVTLVQLLNIFSQENFNYDSNIITIFTLIYDNFNNLGFEKINYNMFITYFYYVCMIQYILNKWDNITNEYLFNNHEKLIYELINDINKQIYYYLNNSGKEKEKANIFFDGLNKLLFNTYDNQAFINEIIKFFDTFVPLNNIFKEENFTIIQNKISMRMYNGGNIQNNTSNMEILLYNKYVPFNKILIWKNMLVNIVDGNTSLPIFYMKSLNYDTLFDIPVLYLTKIIKINDGLFSNNGAINLIKNMELYISDELIDNINNTMLIIIKDLMTNLNILTALNEMLGINTTEDFIKPGPIKPYILKSYKNKSLYIPLKFFFKDTMNAIPLISCMYSDISVRVNNSKKDLFKDFYTLNYIYLPNKRIKTSMLLDFILLERTERKRLTLNKQDNLIEKHNYYTVSQIINTQINEQSEFMYVNFDFNINGLIKEIFWTLDFFVNGYLIENKNFSGENIFNMILSTVFYLDGIKRDGIIPLSTKNKSLSMNINNLSNTPINNIINQYNNVTRTDFNLKDVNKNLEEAIYINNIPKNNVSDLNTSNYQVPNPNNPGDNVVMTSNNITIYNYNDITRLINPYRYNTRVNANNNINTYSFAFEPEKFQPTGAINMDMYNTFRIQLVIDKNKFLKYFGNINTATNLDSIMMTINLSTLEYNLVRYQSGLGGLLFMK